jgi:hypothetical protein
MKPENTRVWRKTARKNKRRIPTGRRATRTVHTTYGRKQRDRDLWAAIQAARELFEAERGPITVNFPADAEA